jgi:hypothetical protein
MAVRNIDKGYISTGSRVSDIDPSNLFQTSCPVVGAITSSVACSFNKIGNIVNLTLAPFSGVVTQTGFSISINLPLGYYPLVNSTQVAVFQAYDSTGTTIGPQLGYFWFNGQHLDCFIFDGNYFVPGTAIQGSLSAVTLTYLAVST